MDSNTAWDEGFEQDENLSRQPGVKVIYTGEGSPKRPKKKPVCLSLTEAQVERIESRCEQTRLNRSVQIQRDLNAYWFLLENGLRRAKSVLTERDARYLAHIFKGRAMSASDDVLWAGETLVAFVRKSGLYNSHGREFAESLAHKMEGLGELARLALMDWIRRAAFSAEDDSLLLNWK